MSEWDKFLFAYLCILLIINWLNHTLSMFCFVSCAKKVACKIGENYLGTFYLNPLDQNSDLPDIIWYIMTWNHVVHK